MALYEVTLRGFYRSQQVINRFHYHNPVVGGATPNALGLLTLLGFIPIGEPPALPADTLFDSILALVNGGVGFSEVEARNMYSATDFYLAAYDPEIPGTVAGVETSPVLAFGLRSNRTTLAVGRGFKRFTGVTEEDMLAGGDLASAAVARVTAVADQMSAVVGEFPQGDYSPCVLAFHKYVAPSGRDAYRPWDTEAEQEEHMAVGVVWAGYPRVRTQTSRQYGRGS